MKNLPPSAIAEPVWMESPWINAAVQYVRGTLLGLWLWQTARFSHMAWHHNPYARLDRALITGSLLYLSHIVPLALQQYQTTLRRSTPLPKDLGAQMAMTTYAALILSAWTYILQTSVQWAESRGRSS